MDKIPASEAVKELTMILLYLTRFSEGVPFSEAEDFFAWKGYDFDVLNKLDDENHIRQGVHPSRSKRVYITERGMKLAKELLGKYQIKDW